MIPVGSYAPGSSPLHRAPAGAKFVGTLLLAALTVPGSTWWLTALCLAVALGYAVARIPLPRLWAPLRALLWMVAAVFVLQAWLLGVHAATLTVLRLVAALGAANLLMLTTRVDEVISTVERILRPLRRFGVRPGRVGLLVGLTLQAVAALSGIASSIQEAAKARGAQRSPVAFAVPFLVRTLKYADELGEALAARGGDDAD